MHVSDQLNNQPTETRYTGKKPLVIFDGDCAMCSGSVNLILKLERSPLMEFAPIRGETFNQLIAPDLHEIDTMMLYLDGQTLIKSDAVLKIAHLLGAPWSFAYSLRFLPRKWRNALYDIIARNRFKIMGRNESCYLPSAEVRQRFWP